MRKAHFILPIVAGLVVTACTQTEPAPAGARAAHLGDVRPVLRPRPEPVLGCPEPSWRHPSCDDGGFAQRPERPASDQTGDDEQGEGDQTDDAQGEGDPGGHDTNGKRPNNGGGNGSEGSSPGRGHRANDDETDD